MTSNGARRKVCVVVTARPSYSRVRSVLAALQDRPDVDMQLVITASALLDRYGNVSTVVEDDGFPITAKVYSIVEGETLVTSAKSTGLGVVELSSVFDALRPDVVVTIADRFETLATAVAASYTNIPVAHLQGGEVTGSIDEKVRHAVTKLADLHFPSTKLAAENLVRLGEAPETIHCTGCPSIDIAAQIRDSGDADAFDPFEQYGGVGARFSPDEDFVIVMQHPVTTEFASATAQITATLDAVSSARHSDLLVLAEYRCRLRRRLEDDPHLPRKRQAEPRPLLPQSAPRRLFEADDPQPMHHRKLERVHPRGLVPWRAGGQYRIATAIPRARSQRDRCRSRP